MRLHRIVREANDFAVWSQKLEADARDGEEDANEIEQYRARYAVYARAVAAGGTKEAQWKRYIRALASTI